MRMRRTLQIYSTAISTAQSFRHHSGVTDWFAMREMRILAIAKYFIFQIFDYLYYHTH